MSATDFGATGAGVTLRRFFYALHCVSLRTRRTRPLRRAEARQLPRLLRRQRARRRRAAVLHADASVADSPLLPHLSRSDDGCCDCRGDVRASPWLYAATAR